MAHLIMAHVLPQCTTFITHILLFHVSLGSAFASRPVPHPNIMVTSAHASFKLSLTNLDFEHPNTTLLQGLQQGLRRSSLRLKHFQHIMATKKHPSSLAANLGVTFESPVSTIPGGFITTAAIGTPGSDLVWRQCLPCDHCYKQDFGPIFNPSQSSTYKLASCSDTLCNTLPSSSCSSSTSDYAPSSCSYTYGYGDGSSTEGDFSYDALVLPDLAGQPQSVPHFAFGCGHNNNAQGNFGGAGGVIGFGQGPISLPSQIHIPKFSYCLQSISDAASHTSPLFMGAAADLQSTSPSDPVVSTPLISNPVNPTFYYVNLKGISVGGNAVGIPSGTFDIGQDGSGGMIFDSGTTITYLPASAYDAVVSAFQASIPLESLDSSAGELGLCYTESSKLLKLIPSLTFHFEGADMQLPLSNYFVGLGERELCLALGSSGEGQTSIYGNIMQQNFHILHDLAAHRLSFTPAACDSHMLSSAMRTRV